MDSNADDWIWCGKCERAYRLSHARNNWFRTFPPEKRTSLGTAYKTRLSGILCTYADCQAPFLKEGISWRRFRENFPEVKCPAIPRYDELYSIYGVSSPVADRITEERPRQTKSIKNNPTPLYASGQVPKGVRPLRPLSLSTNDKKRSNDISDSQKNTKHSKLENVIPKLAPQSYSTPACPICKTKDPGDGEHCRFCNAYIGGKDIPEVGPKKCIRCGSLVYTATCQRCQQEMKHPYDGHRIKSQWWDDD